VTKKEKNSLDETLMLNTDYRRLEEKGDALLRYSTKAIEGIMGFEEKT
jgi:hypothetical protein